MSNTESQLAEALYNHAKDKFEVKLGFEYGSTPPDAGQWHNPAVSYNHYLFHFQNSGVNASELEQQIKQFFMSGLDIPFHSVQDQVRVNLFQQAESMMQSTPMRSWTWANIDQTYYSVDQTGPPFHGVGFAACWRDDTTTYIFLILEVYEGRLSEEILREELFRRLSNDLRRRMDNNPTEKIEPSEGILDLNKCIVDYSTQEFAKSFGFEFTEHPTPPHTKPGGKVATYHASYNSSTSPATQPGDVKSWIDTEIFRRDSKKFPDFAMGEIYDDILRRVQSYGSAEGNPETNIWQIITKHEVYHDPGPRKLDIQQFSQYLFAHGNLTIDLPHNGGKGKVERFFVFFRGVFSTFNRES